MLLAQVDPFVAAGVVAATAATDAYVMFTASVAARRHVPAASWSSVWYLLTSFAVISYTKLDLCGIRGAGLVAWRLRVDDLLAPCAEPSSTAPRADGRLGKERAFDGNAAQRARPGWMR